MASPKPSFCEQCGNGLRPTANFCPACGTSTGNNQCVGLPILQYLQSPQNRQQPFMTQQQMAFQYTLWQSATQTGHAVPQEMLDSVRYPPQGRSQPLLPLPPPQQPLTITEVTGESQAKQIPGSPGQQSCANGTAETREMLSSQQGQQGQQQQPNTKHMSKPKQQHDKGQQQQAFVFGQGGQTNAGGSFAFEKSMTQGNQSKPGMNTQGGSGRSMDVSGDEGGPPIPVPGGESAPSNASSNCRKSPGVKDGEDATDGQETYAHVTSKGKREEHPQNQNTGEGNHLTGLDIRQPEDVEPGGVTAEGNNLADNKSGQEGKASVNGGVQPDNRRDIPENSYVQGAQSTNQTEYISSTNGNLPPALRFSTGQGMFIHFHTIISPEFHFNQKTDKVILVMGTKPFGDFKRKCLELNIEEILVNGYVKVEGYLPVQIGYIKGNIIPYKYQVHRYGQQKPVWEYIHKNQKPYPHVNRALKIPSDACFSGAVWHKYDDVMQLPPDKNNSSNVWKKVSSAFASFKSHLGFNKLNQEEVTKLVHDRQLAVLAYLPDWRGFVVTQTAVEMKPHEAIKLVQQVWDSVVETTVETNGNWCIWIPRGFSGESLLRRYLSPKIESFSHGSTASDASTKTTIDRLISALAISLLVSSYDLQLNWDQWNSLFRGLYFPAHCQKSECVEILTAVKETLKPNMDEIVRGLEIICRKFTKYGEQDWLLLLSVLHFLRGDCTPYAAKTQSIDYMQPRWWGVEKLGVDNGFVANQNHPTDLDALWDSLSPLFEMDPLLRHSFLWFQQTPSGLLRFINHYPLHLLCCSLHVISLRSALLPDEDDQKQFCECVFEVTHRLSQVNTDGALQMPMQQCAQLIDIATSMNLLILNKVGLTGHELITQSCRLLSACYSAHEHVASTQTNPVPVHDQASNVLGSLLHWLQSNLPKDMAMGEGNLCFPQELNVWHQLLSVGFPEQIAATWRDQLAGALSDRIKKVKDAALVELFCKVDIHDLHPDIQQCLSKYAISATGNLLKESNEKEIFKKFLCSSAANKCGELLSAILLQSWPSKDEDGDKNDDLEKDEEEEGEQGEEEDDEHEDSILYHILIWAPLCNFFSVIGEGNTNQENLLNEEAKEKLAIAKSTFDAVCRSLMDGSIKIGQLRLLMKDDCYNQFIRLHTYNEVHACAQISQEGGQGSVKATQDLRFIVSLLEARNEELKVVETQWEWNACMLQMCKIIEPVECIELDQKLSNNLRDLSLLEVCQPLPVQNLLDGTKMPPHVTYFAHPAEVMAMLQPMYDIRESHLFGNLWRIQADNVREASQQDVLSLSDVAAQIWQPVMQQLQEINTKFTTASILLTDVDLYFKDLRTRESWHEIIRGELTKILSLKGEADTALVQERFNQIVKYYDLQQASALAGVILNVRDVYELTGDFQAVENMFKLGSDKFKSKLLRTISEVENVAKGIDTTEKYKQLVDCLKPLVKCKELIAWIYEEIKNERQLEVFVELAMNNAGEMAMEVDRVSFFHRAASGYAPFIFGLRKEANCRELLTIAEKVRNALDTDAKLPTLLMDTQKELPWLRQVKESQGDVEMSSLIQVQAINARGIYTIGKIEPKNPGDKLTTLELKVPPDRQSRGRTYNCDDLKDLQSKLTLVAGKAKGSKERQDEVDYFVEVFTAVQQLASLYEKLKQAGSILFSEWRALLYCGHCGERSYSVHVSFDVGDSGLLTGKQNLLAELHFLREFMDNCLREWYKYIEERRSECYELNYYTTEQLVLLRHNLANLWEQRVGLPAKILVLLSAVKSSCTEIDVISAVQAAARDIRHPVDEAVTTEQAEAAAEAVKQEKAKQIVKELMEEYGFTKKLAWAAIQELGIDKESAEYMEWCVTNTQNDSLIESLTSDLQDLELTEDVGCTDTEQSAIGEDTDENASLAAFPCIGQTTQEVTTSLMNEVVERNLQGSLQKQLTELWQKYLETTIATNIEDCLSLEHLGLILKHLHTDSHALHRRFPGHLSTEQPNLLVCPSGEIWMTVLSLYMYQGGTLPTPEEVFICSETTTLEEVVLLWRRAIGDRLGRVFCLVGADQLDYDVSVKAELELAGLMSGKQDYHLIVVCSSDRDDSSHIVAALDQYRREIPVNPRPEDIKRYLQEQFSAHGPDEAAAITRHKSHVEVIVSNRPGVGKSLTVQRYAEDLPSIPSYQQHYPLMHITWHVTVPLFQAVVEKDAVVKALLPHQNASNDSDPMIYHIDVSPVVHEGLDEIIFNLLILGGLCDSHGQVWRCKPRDLYLLEITDFDWQHRNTQEISTNQLYSLLPCVTCHAPSEVRRVAMLHHRLGTPQGRQRDDPKFDEQEFNGRQFQRAFQYLSRYQQPQDLDGFEFDGESEGDKGTILATLLKYCGVENPSWSELRHFAYFLSSQLEDCQNSIYCNEASGLQGFKGFVVKFLVQMARDFATPSLFMSEESPSRAAMVEVEAADGSDHEGADAEENEPQPTDLEQFQLRRRWETSPHPYIFFNHDHETMTFMGFLIDEECSLVDRTNQQVIEERIIDPGLKQVLEQNHVQLDEDFDSLSRMAKLQQLCMVLGVDNIIDPDKTYELTTDNVMKILAIHMRFRCGIPVVIMGETGCGKTRLIRFLCQLQGGVEAREGGINNMILMKVHGGTTCEAIIRKINRAQEIALTNKELHDLDTVLFFDEMNTTEAIGLIKEIMCDGRVNGQHIDMADGALKIIAACNPYRRHTDEMIERLKVAGLGYRVAAEDTQEKLGKIPLRELVYRVQALPPSMLPLVWDFGQLSADVEAKYIGQIVQRYVASGRLAISDPQALAITNVLFASQQFMRAQKNECSFVSLRDVERCLEVLVWFHNHMNLLRPRLEGRTDGAQDIAEGGRREQARDDLTPSLVLAIGVCYHACLQEGREDYRRLVALAFLHPCYLPGGADQILQEITRCQDVFLEEVQLDDNIARNSALKENVFMMVVCIELRIPLFLVGKPGSSKSLSKKIVGDAMQGESSRSDLFKKLKRVHMTSFQCSPLSTPEGIVGTFRQCSKFQEGKDLDKFVSVVVLDEVGLAEDSPRMPLKTLHPLLETGSEEDEEYPAPHKKVGFIGLSNWALDPAKMNRGILVSREVPDQKELVETARGICASDAVVQRCLEPFIPPFAEAYLALCQGQDREYFGLRDYYSLIKMIYHFCKESMRNPTWAQIVYSVRRNFGGLPSIQDPVQEFEKHFPALTTDEEFPGDPNCKPSNLLKDSLDGHAASHGGESRYPLILTRNYAALPIIQHLLGQEDVITIFGSSFPYDQEYTQVCRNINRIKVCMETGRTVVLLNLENLYESLYDALNQYYVYFGDQRYVDLGLGIHRVKCRVHKDFRLIVIADKDVVYERFPTPLINRLEKHFLATSTMLTMNQQEILKQLEKWVEEFAAINCSHQVRHKYNTTDAFVGYHGDTLASLVFQVCHEMNHTEGDQQWKDMVCDEVKDLMLECATPDAVIRVGDSKLMREAEYWFDKYFHQQDHSSLVSFLQKQLDKDMDDESTQQELMAQVTTHSRPLVKTDINQLQTALGFPVHAMHLQNFQTEHQFCAHVRQFYKNCEANEGLLLVQCEDGHHNNQLIACASYCIQDERTQAKRESHPKPAHVVFVIQLSCGGKGFTSFQGSGIWRSVHVDDLHPPQANRPEVSALRDVDILKVFEQDPDIQPLLGSEMDVDMEEVSEDTDAYQDGEEDTDGVASMEEDEPADLSASVDGAGDAEISASVEGGEDAAPSEQDRDAFEEIRDSESLMEEEEQLQTMIPQEQLQTMVPQEQLQTTVPQEAEAVECCSPVCTDSEQHIDEELSESSPCFDINCLIKDSLHTASARISDSEQTSERATERIAILLNLMAMECPDEPGLKSFLCTFKQRLYQLLKEREARRASIAKSWLSREALAVGEKQKSGTFRKAIWQHLISTMSPLLAELVAYCDCNDNLSLLLKHPPADWQHQLWLAVLTSPKVAPIHYEDFISPTNQVREKALVKKMGTSDRHVTAHLAFSYLLKEDLTAMHRQALELKATSDERVDVIFKKLAVKSPWYHLLKHFVPPEASQNFMHSYMMDFIRMVYKSSSCNDNELECVSHTLEISSQLLARELNMQHESVISSAVLLHLAHGHIQGKLAHFARLAEVCPELVNETNRERLMKREGEVTLDATAIKIAMESLLPDKESWKDSNYRRDWLQRIQIAKPVLDTTMQTVMHGNREDYGEAAVDIVMHTRGMWEAICVLKLFVEHVCPPSIDSEEVLASQALMLWMLLKGINGGMKSINGIKAVENVLSVCSNSASNTIFKTDIGNCHVCKKVRKTDPVQLPCEHVFCRRCIITWFEDSGKRVCPQCKRAVPDDFELQAPTESREALEKFSTFRQHCNAFFMDIVSQLCFAGSEPPSREVIQRLLEYVTKETETDNVQQVHTKRMTAFKDDSIDATPVIRSVLLQLLLQSNVDDVQEYIDTYLYQSQRILADHKPQNIVDVCMLFINCMEDSYHRQYHSNLHDGKVIEKAITKLTAGKDWLATKDPDEGLTMQYLTAIAQMRYGLVIAATFLHKLYCFENPQEDTQALELVDTLFDQANEMCHLQHEAHLFLVRHLCHCYGSSTMDTLSQHRELEWVRPAELETQHDDIPDRFVICGRAYGVLREAVAQAIISGQYNTITNALERCMELTESQRQTSLLLALFREVTMSYGRDKDRQIPEQVMEQLTAFLTEEVEFQQKEFVMHMIKNKLSQPTCTQLEVHPGQGVLHQSVLALVMHSFITLLCAPYDSPLLRPLLGLLYSPEKMQRSYLPTMPEDMRLEARRAVREHVQWYECPNGHPYAVGKCGRPVMSRKCNEIGCNADIGGSNHELVEGNRRAFMTDRDMRGHTLGEAHARSGRAAPERQLPPMAVSILRIILHSTMIGQAVVRPQEIQQLIHPEPRGDIGEFLWQHVMKDLDQLAASCGKSPDDCLVIVHMVLQLIAAKKQKRGRIDENWDALLTSKNSREAWEAAFSRRYIVPVMENLETELVKANEALQADERFSANPLMHLLHQQQTTEVISQEDMKTLHTFPAVWQYRPQVTIESLQQYLERQNAPGDQHEDAYALLRRFLEKSHILSVLHHLPGLIRLQQLLLDRYHRRINAAEAKSITIQDFLDDTPKELHHLVTTFINVWNQVRENISSHGGVPVPRELCIRVMNEADSLAMLLPTHKEDGVCSTALVDFLISTHNEFMEFYYDLTGDKPRCERIQPCDVTVSHLVTFDKDRDLLPMVLAHKDYEMQADQGTTHTFNLLGLQRQIEERFVRGHPKIFEEVAQLVFRQDSQDTAVFQALRGKIPQKSLSPAIQHQIVSQIKSVSDLSDCLAALDIAIRFLGSSSNSPGMRISDYLRDTLSLPEDRGIRLAPKAHEYCRLRHILSLWQTLAVELACRQIANEQDPFEGVALEFHVPLSNDQIADLCRVRRQINIKDLVAELYEYIILNMQRIENQEQDIKQWSIVDVLEVSLDEKDVKVHGLREHFPDDIRLQHAVHTWKTLLDFAQPQPTYNGTSW